MSKREVQFYLVDIFIAYDKIQRYTNRFKTAQEFLHSELEWDATLRELEIIAEATNNLLKMNFLDNQYRIIVDFRNEISHGYFGVDENIVWDVISVYLKEFYDELFMILKQNSIDLSDAIYLAKEENTYNEKTINFLNSLEL